MLNLTIFLLSIVQMTFEPALGIDFKDVEDILMLHGFHFMSNYVFMSFLSTMILILEHCSVSMAFQLLLNVKRIDNVLIGLTTLLTI
jgi:hypothetical protein